MLEDESRTPTSNTVISDGEISSRSSDIDTNDVSMYVNVSNTSLASASSSKDDSSEDIGMICDARKRAANPSSSDLSPKKKQARDVVSKRDDVHNPYRNLQSEFIATSTAATTNSLVPQIAMSFDTSYGGFV